MTVAEQLGPFVLKEKLGQGSMGTVYRCSKDGFDRDLAIKILSPDISHDQEFLRRFEREGKIASSLKHEHIVSVHEAGHYGDSYYILLELITGPDLREHLTALAQPMEWPGAVAWTAQILEALAHAHEHGVVHRDVKPANIMLSEGSKPLLTDFSVAHSHEGTRLTSAGTLLGTPEYMSPEQFSDAEVDGRTDVYATSIILYELLTGTQPFRARSIPEVIKNQLFINPQSPCMLNPAVPRPLGALVLKGLAKQPEHRFASASEMAAALRRMLANSDPAQRDTVCVLMLAHPAEPDATHDRLKPWREALNSQFRRAGVFVFHWSREGAMVLFNETPRAFQCARKVVAEEKPAPRVVVVTGEVYPDPAYLSRHPGLGQFACETTDLGCRMLTLAPAGEVLVCGRSRGLLRDLGAFRAVEEVWEGESFFLFGDGPVDAAPQSVDPDIRDEEATVAFQRPATMVVPPPDPVEEEPAREDTETRRKRVHLPRPPEYRVKTEKSRAPERSNPLPALIAYLLIFAAIVYGAYLFVAPRGTLVLECQPEVVTLTIDKGGRQAYHAGDNLSLAPGNHWLVVSAKGYKAAQQKVSVKEEGPTKLSIRLKPTP